MQIDVTRDVFRLGHGKGMVLGTELVVFELKDRKVRDP